MSFLKKALNMVNTAVEIKQTITYTPDIICSNGSKIRKDCIYSRYDLNDVKKLKSNSYLLGNSNIPLAIDEIMYVNAFLMEAAHLLSYFPRKQISQKNLCFKERVVNGIHNAFCYISFIPLTDTGKKPKYPMVLHFYNSDDLFGNLSYGQSGEIDKGDIVVWGKDTCYEVKLRLIGNELKLHTIYQTNPGTGKKQKIYYQ